MCFTGTAQLTAYHRYHIVIHFVSIGSIRIPVLSNDSSVLRLSRIVQKCLLLPSTHDLPCCLSLSFLEFLNIFSKLVTCLLEFGKGCIPWYSGYFLMGDFALSVRHPLPFIYFLEKRYRVTSHVSWLCDVTWRNASCRYPSDYMIIRASLKYQQMLIFPFNLSRHSSSAWELIRRLWFTCLEDQLYDLQRMLCTGCWLSPPYSTFMIHI